MMLMELLLVIKQSSKELKLMMFLNTHYHPTITICTKMVQFCPVCSPCFMHHNTGLHSYEEVTIQVAAKTEVGLGPYSFLNVFYTSEDGMSMINNKFHIISSGIQSLTLQLHLKLH